MSIFQHAPITWTADTKCDTANFNQEIKEKMDDIDAQFPAGTLQPTARDSAPTGWLLCQGQAISRTTYAALFAAISTKYGIGDGSTTFNVPNLKGKVPVGLDSGDADFDDRGKTGGAKIPTTSGPTETAGGQVVSGGGYIYNHIHTVSVLQPYVVINWEIKT